MKEIYLNHFHTIIMHSVEDKDYQSPIAVHGPTLINQLKIGCSKKDGFRLTRLSWLSHFYGGKLPEWYCSRCFGGKFSKFPIFWISLCPVHLLLMAPSLLETHRHLEIHRGSHCCNWVESWGALLTCMGDHRVQLSIQLIKNVHSEGFFFAFCKKAFRIEMVYGNGQHPCKLQPFFKHNSKHNIL